MTYENIVIEVINMQFEVLLCYLIFKKTGNPNSQSFKCAGMTLKMYLRWLSIHPPLHGITYCKHHSKSSHTISTEKGYWSLISSQKSMRALISDVRVSLNGLFEWLVYSYGTTSESSALTEEDWKMWWNIWNSTELNIYWSKESGNLLSGPPS